MAQSVTIQKFANRRLHDPHRGIDLTLEELAEMLEEGEAFVVQDARTAPTSRPRCSRISRSCGTMSPRPPPFAGAQKKCCAIKKCPEIDRGAQNGSRTPLKMFSLLQMRSALPCGNAVGFPVPGLHG
jgi:PHB accumulation regulatory protein